MIETNFSFNQNSNIEKFVISGHGEVGLHKDKKTCEGNDILCAGVSTLVQSILIGLNYVIGQKPVIVQKENGLLECKITNPDNERVIDLLKTLYLSLKNLQDQYPNNIIIVDKR